MKVQPTGGEGMAVVGVKHVKGFSGTSPIRALVRRVIVWGRSLAAPVLARRSLGSAVTACVRLGRIYPRTCPDDRLGNPVLCPVTSTR